MQPILSKIDELIVGIHVLARKLLRMTSICNCLPDIMKKIKEKLNQRVADLD